ncbi:hypothetical protein Pcinc_023855 [Petrolisthes cinctipes]|uniref:DnaJ-like protein n=1 Tax=Petrolisthes cinctipes TaxID=88211 RepID=A0AAE1KG68_PETCI|nr:hypothetical protein Pcinc_023855 [Petrolisthes cinctipes]
MSKKNNDLMKLDIYEILGLSLEAEEKEIKKAYRKKALECHPDKNPNNPAAAEEFDRLKKILEVLLDAGTRKAYDKVLKGRKAAALRAREADSKTQKLRADLEARERLAHDRPYLSEEEKLKRELKRLEEEGQRIIEEELARVNAEVERELKRGSKSATSAEHDTLKPATGGHKVKVKWATTKDWSGYSEEEIRQVFYKWGDILAVVLKLRSRKGTALIEFKTKQAADMAVQYEKGQPGKSLEVCHLTEEPEKRKKEKKEEKKESGKPNYDFESVAAMNKRRQDERKKLIEEILKEEASA